MSGELTATHAALDQLLRLAGEIHAPVAILDGEPALKTRFHAEAAAAAALAAGGAMAARLWELRGGARQDVSVDLREAAAGLTSFVHQRFADPTRKLIPGPGSPGGDARTPASGFFATRDGRWVYLHPSFPKSAEVLHRIVDAPADREAAAAAVLRWDAQALEDAIAEAGVCGAKVRTPEEWDASEQGRVLAARPVVEVVRIGESAPEPLSVADRPLSGVRVLDLTRVLAGPTCARTLAQYGAEVLYVASPNLPSVEGFVTDTNHGTLSAFLNLSEADGRARLAELVRTGDVFSQSYRGGALERLGFGPLDLARLRPGIICTEINCYGHEGPWRNRPGWEQLAQTVTGLAHVHGGYAFDGERGPQLQPGAVTDYTTGFLAAFGTMIALDRRARFGGSYLVRVSLAQTGAWVRGLGLAPPEKLDAVRPLDEAEIDGWRIERETGFGGMRFLRPPVRLSETPTGWTRPVVPLGTHTAAWPEAA